MKLPQKYAHLIDRVDAMTLRERVMIFSAAVVVLVTLVNSLLIDPLLARQQDAVRKLDLQQTQISTIQAQITALASTRSNAATAVSAKSAELAKLTDSLATIERKITEQEQTLVQPERVNALLSEIVRRNRGIQLLSLKNLPVADAGGAASGNALFRHAVEIKVTGGFMDIVRYLTDLERLPFKATWGALSLDSSGFPQISMAVTITTLSTAKPWLQI